MKPTGTGNTDWGRVADRVSRESVRYKLVVRLSLFFYVVFGISLFIMLAGLSGPLLALVLMAALFAGAVALAYEGLYRWRRRLNLPAVRERITIALVQGPQYICEIYHHTPRAFRFMLGAPPSGIRQAAAFMGHNLNWYTRPPASYRPAVALAGCLAGLLGIGFSLAYLNLTGSADFFSDPGHWQFAFACISAVVLNSACMYFVYLLERQVLALDYVAGIVRGLTAGE